MLRRCCNPACLTACASFTDDALLFDLHSRHRRCCARYDAEAPEALPVPDFEARLSKFERMCIVRCRRGREGMPPAGS